MTIEALKEAISEIISAPDCSAEFYFLVSRGDELHVKQADMDEDSQRELSDNFIASLSGRILLNDDVSLIDISAADDRMHAIYRYDLDEVPHQLTKLSAILENDEFEVFDFGEDSLDSLEGILILIGNNESQLALYKHQYPVALLKRNSGFSLIRSGERNRLRKLDEDVLKINAKFEFMKIGEEYYIVDIKALERFFGFHEAIKNVATQGIKNIEDSNLIEDVEVLTARIDDISFSRKLVKVARGSPVLGVIPNADVVSFCNSHPALRGKFSFSDDGVKLKLKTKTSQALFLKLLNDDFLQSELTKRYYASLAKDDIAPTPTPTP